MKRQIENNTDNDMETWVMQRFTELYYIEEPY